MGKRKVINAYGPGEQLIVGQLVRVAGNAYVRGFELDPKSGTYIPDFADNTEMFWDDTVDVKNENGEVIYLDDDDNEYAYSELTFREEEEEVAGDDD